MMCLNIILQNITLNGVTENFDFKVSYSNIKLGWTNTSERYYNFSGF